MRHIKIAGRNYMIPTQWSEVTLARHNAARVARRKHAGYARRSLCACISALCGFDEAVIFSMTEDQVAEITRTLEFYFTTAPTPKTVDCFEIDGQVFYVTASIRAACFGEFVDIDTQITQFKDDPMLAVAGILAVYCRLKDEPFAMSNQDLLEKRQRERTQIMGKLDMETAEGLAAFFLTSALNSKSITSQLGALRVSLTYKVRQLEASVRATVGLRRFSAWPKAIFAAWMRSRLKAPMTS